ncbi:MAG TPA: glycosyltransferase [Pyrinomonadaceae bacterium]
MKFSVLIPTYNRSGELRKTLQSLRELSGNVDWEVIVVDNNSNDDTREVVADIAKTFPVELRYLFEREQGKPAALNSGMAIAHGDVIAFTDDDHRFEPDWLEQAARGLEQFKCDYVGGKILPLFEGQCPRWLTTSSGRHRSVIGMADYGPEAHEFADRPAMGGNLVVRRDAFSRVGLWDNRLGRRGKTLLGQEQREWCMRARAVGLRGFYIPEMNVYHIVPRERLEKKYFRRWFYWHGISRAILHENFGLDMEAPEDTVLDFSKVPRIAGVPRYMFRTFLTRLLEMAKAAAKNDPARAFDEELWFWFFAGIFRQRWKNRHNSIPTFNTAQQVNRGS